MKFDRDFFYGGYGRGGDRNFTLRPKRGTYEKYKKLDREYEENFLLVRQKYPNDMDIKRVCPYKEGEFLILTDVQEIRLGVGYGTIDDTLLISNYTNKEEIYSMIKSITISTHYLQKIVDLNYNDIEEWSKLIVNYKDSYETNKTHTMILIWILFIISSILGIVF